MWCDKYSTLLSRVSFTEGSFFDKGKVPAADSNSTVFTMRQILHDWSDADCISILKQVRGLAAHVCWREGGSRCVQMLTGVMQTVSEDTQPGAQTWFWGLGWVAMGEGNLP